MDWTQKQKEKACTETLLLYLSLSSDEQKLIPEWFVESLQRYYSPAIAAKTSAERVMRNMSDETGAVTQILLYFGYQSTAKELNEVVTPRNRDFLINLMSYKYGED